MRRRRSLQGTKASQKSAAPLQRHLVVMVKVPVMGRVKTRLARQVGYGAATAFYRHTAAAVLARLARDPRWQTSLAVAPDAGVRCSAWPCQIRRQPQGTGDLGARMQRIMESCPPGPVIIIGTDIPAIRPAHIARAFRALGRADAVIGPAPDGGYWLVGLKRCPRVLSAFRNVRWSSAETRADTAANLIASRVALTDVLRDVDNAEDLRLTRGYQGRRTLPSPRL
jgi:uncharacterized protein